MQTSPLQTLIGQLRTLSERIHALEAEAKTALYEEQDRNRYEERLREKAGLLARLEEDAAANLARLPEGLRVEAGSALRAIAEDAANAFRVDSIFYMAVLLAPEQDGEPNELDQLLEYLEKEGNKGMG